MNYLLNMLFILPGILIGLAFHEFSHGLAADKLGDPTPRAQGRLTIEPWPHIDLFGFLALLLIGFGWAKPVQIDGRYFKKPKRDEIIVSIAGPLANLCLALLFGLVVYGLASLNILQNLNDKAIACIFIILYYAIWINVVLFVFNLLPIPPLDGSHIVANLLPREQARKYMDFGAYFMISILILILIGNLTHFDIISLIVFPPMKLIYSLILTLFGLPDALGILG